MRACVLQPPLATRFQELFLAPEVGTLLKLMTLLAVRLLVVWNVSRRVTLLVYSC